VLRVIEPGAKTVLVDLTELAGIANLNADKELADAATESRMEALARVRAPAVQLKVLINRPFRTDGEEAELISDSTGDSIPGVGASGREMDEGTAGKTGRIPAMHDHLSADVVLSLGVTVTHTFGLVLAYL
jgi:hypothetical protein